MDLKGACSGCRVKQGRFDMVVPVFRQERVRVEKEEDVADSPCCSCIHLPAAARRLGKHGCAEEPCQFGRTVNTSTIHHDDLDVITQTE